LHIDVLVVKANVFQIAYAQLQGKTGATPTPYLLAQEIADSFLAALLHP
jgi:hypothetical protein